MASRFEEEQPAPKECANCGATDDLLRCSRCRAEWFCSLACHKAYWPFHRQTCKRNDFADVVEEGDPRFAAWLRRHGKQAILGDAEVDRLERAGRAVSGSGREDVMQSMYGRLDPKPEGPKYSPEERFRVQERERQEAMRARLMSRQERAWSAISVEPGMGMECSRYKWTQNQSHVYVFVRVPEGTTAARLRVQLTSGSLALALGLDEQPLLDGKLYGNIKAEHSTWFVDDGVLQLQLLKLCRRGHYAAGTTNADTWWRSLWAYCPPAESLQRRHPPTRYYWSEYEESDLPPPLPARRVSAQAPPAAAAKSGGGQAGMRLSAAATDAAAAELGGGGGGGGGSDDELAP
ncbi:hypothetical protein PLESTB_000172800 [Pleodorina starrii]|uniref:MYND-type domain-containing protein n=1 Tax=Pleodorina starrii TaxID=330485 RepID=A0A9W6BCH3_9CHLO|nr:hypothetical protein PLESTM_000524000 [Pleodorina starrii]GLC49011.1 hypothetical protein PLESTB_000172800 [Pleodorina starrii]GLC66194.1 hypothetical protein PLESTF_000395100 [Pleodorina starrii]